MGPMKTAQVHRMLIDGSRPHVEHITAHQLDVTHTAIDNFLHRRQKKPFRYEQLILAFLEAEGILDRGWYDSLPTTENKIEFLAKKQPEAKKPLELEGFYVHESYAFREGLISVLLGRPTAKGIFGFKLSQKIYTLRKDAREKGKFFQQRIESGLSDEELRLYGCAYSNGHQNLVQILEDTYNAEPTNTTLYGVMTRKDDGGISQFELRLSSDEINRRYLRYTQDFDYKQKYTKYLSKKLINNIIQEGRFYKEPKQHKEHMQPIYFEERICNFSELDFEFLAAAEQADTAEMLRCLFNGADVNVCDPATGQTALHKVAQSLSPLAACLLVPKHRTSFVNYDAVSEELNRYLAAELGLDIEDVTFQIGVSQRELNPLHLDKNYEFASSGAEFMARLPDYMSNELEDPLMPVREDMERIVGTSIKVALKDLGIPFVLPDMEKDDRIEILNDYKTRQEPLPEPEF